MKKGFCAVVTVLFCLGAAACGAGRNETENTGISTSWSGSGLYGDVSENRGGDGSAGNTDSADAVPLTTDAQIEEAARNIERELGERIYELRGPVEEAADFCGEWNRTQIHTGLDGTFVIAEQTKESFTFELFCQYFYHTGALTGEAWFVTPELAIAKILPYEEDEEQYVSFVWSKNDDGETSSYVLTVSATGMDYELGLGNRVSVDGEYCREEPVYTNAGQFEEYFGGEVDDFMRAVLFREDYEMSFRLPAEIGFVREEAVVLEQGRTAKRLTVEVPTDGWASFVVIVSEDGHIYAEFEHTAGFVTNDMEAMTMPEYTKAES